MAPAMAAKKEKRGRLKERPKGRPRSSGFTVTLRSTLQVRDNLDHLKKTGLFGKSISEVAEELMRAQLRHLSRTGWPAMPDKPETPNTAAPTEAEEPSR
jgi:hypothetical protein